MKTGPKQTRDGWTLLELMLALALTTMLLSGIYGALHLYYRGVTTTRVNVERDQLARTVLRRVSDDLRSAVRYMPADTSGLSGAASGGLTDAAAALGAATGSSGSSGSGSSGSGSSGSGSSGTGSSGSGSSGSSSGTSGSSGSSGSSSGSSGSGSSSGSSTGGSSSGSSESTETTEPATAQTIPGVYGSLNWLQIDVCRLPRPDEIVANANNGSPTSEVRTVTYTMGQGNDPNGLPALLRMEASRAVSLYGSTTGSVEGGKTSVLAAEVASVEFRYYDSAQQQWVESWDSTAMGSVPPAIDVRMVMRNPDQQAAADSSLDGALAADVALSAPDSVFRLVIHLPAALTPNATSGSTTTTEDPAAAADGGSTTPSTPTGGASADSPSGSSGGSSGSSGGSSGSSGGTKGGSSGGTKGGNTGGVTVPGGNTGPGGTGSPGGSTTTPTPPATPMTPTDPMMMP